MSIPLPILEATNTNLKIFKLRKKKEEEKQKSLTIKA